MPIALDDLTGLARALIDADAKVTRIESELKEAVEHARRLREDTIPCVMQELELDQISLSNGMTMTLKEEVYASISKDNAPAAFEWLTQHDYDGIIKTAVMIEWGKGELKKAIKFFQRTLKKYPNAVLDRNVHPQTLKAFLRERLAAADSFPMELFGARAVTVVKLKDK